MVKGEDLKMVMPQMDKGKYNGGRDWNNVWEGFY